MNKQNILSPYIIDVREPHEFAGSHVAGAMNLPLGELMNNPQGLQAVPLEADVVVYCRSGGRAGMACSVLQARGYQNVRNGINQTAIEASGLTS